MKLLIFSDTHHALYVAKSVIERIKDRMDMFIHLGDHDLDAVELSKEFPDIPVHYVAGNCDFGSSSPTEKIIRVGGKKILMIHGHKHNVKWGYDRISYYGEEKEVDVVLFGHTHIPLIEYSGRVLIFNPGSISQPRGTITPTFGILDIDRDGRIEPAIMTIGKDKEINRLKMV
ncbi:metallophosphoesterase family protein [Defluviitalea raffinosedens]|uniref:metallophosphoesterase family protein n=1 Tax=Defluviitalea raffinosedens TaxID=1450156 RepID=UPI00195E6AAD|nr:metallophosphoesterase [Defluviitalea raffinosedens]MBM7684838.1 putative phosphoesterase [Defluviitalea raffinosedens]